MLIKNASKEKVYLHGHSVRLPGEGREVSNDMEIKRLLRCPNLKEVKKTKEVKREPTVSKKKSK